MTRTKGGPEKVHSALGASSAFRWMECPGSVRLSEGLPNITSEAAGEGTAAHALAEVCLKRNKGPHDYLGDVIEGYEVTEEMADAVKMYVDYVRSRTIQQFEVVDLKYGRGLPVEVKDNRQLKYYALGAYLAMQNGDIPRGSKVYEQTFSLDSLKPPIPMFGTADAVVAGRVEDGIVVTIIQPRVEHPDGPIRSTRFTLVQLLDFADELIDAAHRTQAPDAPLVPGEAQCRWCKAKAVCPALHDKALAVAQAEFDDLDAVVLPNPDHLPDDVLVRALGFKDQLKGWLASVEAYVSRRVAEDPNAFGGQFKLVARRAVRKWTDPDRVETWAREQGLDDEDIFQPRKLKSPAQLERQVKGEARKALQNYTEKKSSGVELVPVYDKRPAITRGSEFDALPPAISDDSD
jgi:hypothetical protein